MKIRLVGLNLRLHAELTLDELVAKLQTNTGTVFEIAKVKRALVLGSTPKYVVGCMLTVRGGRSIPQINLSSLKLSIHNLPEGENFGAFNFFLISKKNNAGLYAHYSGSCPTSLFCDFLDKRGKDALGPKLTSALQNGGVRLDQKQKSAVIERYSTAVDWRFLLCGKDFAEVVKDWRSLKSLSYSITKLSPGEKSFGPLSPFVRSESHRLSLGEAEKTEGDTTILGSVVAMAGALVNFLEGFKYKSARVEGVDEDGHERSIQVANAPDWFGDMDFEDAAKSPALFPDDVTKSIIIQKLIQAADRYPLHFEKPIP